MSADYVWKVKKLSAYEWVVTTGDHTFETVYENKDRAQEAADRMNTGANLRRARRVQHNDGKGVA